MLLHYAVLNQLCRRHGLEDGRARVTLRPLLADGHHHAPVWDGTVHEHVFARVCEHVGKPATVGGAKEKKRRLRGGIAEQGWAAIGPIVPRGVEVGLLYKRLQASEGTKVPAGVAVEQVILLIDWEVAETAVFRGAEYNWRVLQDGKTTQRWNYALKKKSSSTSVVDREGKDEHVTSRQADNRVRYPRRDRRVCFLAFIDGASPRF